MAKSAASTLERLVSRLHEQTLDVVNLRTALDVQMNRISQMRVNVDMLPEARKRRQLRALLPKQPSPDGNR